MPTVTTMANNRVESAEISDETYIFLRDGAALRKQDIVWLLRHIAELYGSLTEATITRYMEEKGVL